MHRQGAFLPVCCSRMSSLTLNNDIRESDGKPFFRSFLIRHQSAAVDDAILEPSWPASTDTVRVRVGRRLMKGVRQLPGDSQLLQRLLVVGCVSTTLLIGLIAAVFILRTVVLEAWVGNGVALKHYRALLGAVAVDERFVLQARRAVSRVVEPGAGASISAADIARLEQQPEGSAVQIDGLSWLPPFMLFKSASPAPALDGRSQAEARKRQQLAVAVRVMSFDAAMRVDSENAELGYYLSADGSLAVLRPSLPHWQTKAGAEELSCFAQSMRERFLAVLDGKRSDEAFALWTPVYRHPVTGRETLTVFSAARDASGHLYGFIAKDVALQALERMVLDEVSEVPRHSPRFPVESHNDASDCENAGACDWANPTVRRQ